MLQAAEQGIIRVEQVTMIFTCETKYDNFFLDQF